MTTATPVHEITAVILAGGKARRMDGADKGLITLQGRPMVDYIISALRPQAGDIIINANRNREQYSAFGLPVVADMLGDYFGPLVGMATGMHTTDKPYIVTTPCDSPFIPDTLVETLYRTLEDQQADISVAHDGTRMQPVFALLRCELLPGLLAYLNEGGRKIDTWYDRHRLALADFSGSPDTFMNLNTPEDRIALESRIAG
jgi:molybdenum cofactor guanylyltransferase